MQDPLAEHAPTLTTAQAQDRLYLPASYLQLLEKLEHIARFSPLIQVMTGPQRSGKTTLLKRLAKSFADDEAEICLIEPSYDTSAGEFLSLLADTLQLEMLSSATVEQKLQTLIQGLQNLHQQNRFLLVLVDNGEYLNQELQQLLFEQFPKLNENHRPHIVIAAQPVFSEGLRSSLLFQQQPEEFGHFAEIPPLDIVETKEFLQLRHPEEAEHLTDKAVAEIHRRSFGLPGLIEKALTQEQNSPAPQKNSFKYGRLLGQSLLVLVLIGIGGGVGYSLWSLYVNPQDGNDQVSIALPAPVSIKPDAKTAAPMTASTAPEQALPADALASSTEPSDTDSNTGTVSPHQETPDSTTESPDNLEIASIAEKAPEAPVEEEIPVLTTPAKNKLVLELKPTVKSTVKATGSSTSETTESTSTTSQQIATKPAQTSPEPAVIRADHPYLREDELLSWNANGYTLQLLGARKEASVVGFIDAHPDKNKFYYFSTIYKEKPWYVIVYGQYQSRNEAVAAIRSLPDDLKKQKPWARSIKGVQADIRRDK